MLGQEPEVSGRASVLCPGNNWPEREKTLGALHLRDVGDVGTQIRPGLQAERLPTIIFIDVLICGDKAPQEGFEPPTKSLEGSCSIP